MMIGLPWVGHDGTVWEKNTRQTGRPLFIGATDCLVFSKYIYA